MQHRFPAELSGCTGFQWDAGNQRKSADKHSVSQAEAEQVFRNRPLLLRSTYGRDTKEHGSEERQLAHGKTNAGRLLTIVFTFRHPLIRVISARAMRKADRKIYGQETDS